MVDSGALEALVNCLEEFDPSVKAGGGKVGGGELGGKSGANPHGKWKGGRRDFRGENFGNPSKPLLFGFT